MNIEQNKISTLKNAINNFVKDGCHLSIGGFTINRNPMAAVHEIIRQKKKNLHLYVHSNGQGLDELIGAGCISKVELAYAGSGKFAPTCIRFRKAVQEKKIIVEDYTNFQMGLRFLAGSMGVPFLPTKSSLGSDIIEKWGFSKEMRKKEKHIPNQKLIVVDNPFDEKQHPEKVVLVPAINPDVTIIHVQKADKNGTCRIEGLTFADIEQAKAAKYLIITCEELLETNELKKDADRNQIPFMFADAVVHLPFGAYPTACYNYYDYDSAFLKEYANCASDKTENAFQNYLTKYIFNVKNHEEFLNIIGQNRLKKIKADPETGYSKDMKR
ncbi:MAG: hypothetical protein K8R41_10240 [Bacteroidales bacterium]|nr:hypothetical protein [Bacteroidales bacterium]